MVVENTLKNVFFLIFKNTSNFIKIKMSEEVEEPIGRSVLLFLSAQKWQERESVCQLSLLKTHKFTKISKNENA